MHSRHMDIILIPSTLCNLRCSYCYELDKLSDKGRMSHELVDEAFEQLAEHFRTKEVDSVRFVWHGGEPLLLPPDYYYKCFELQKKHFSDLDVRYVNVTQTNLTVLDDERLELLRSGFDTAGVSLDLFGSLRVNAAGKCMEEKSLKNLDIALGRGVRLGGVTVLSKANCSRVKDIYAFYRERDMGFRLLPLHAGDYAAGQWFEITPADTLEAFCTLADLWLTDERAPLIHPVVGVINDVLNAHLDGEATGVYDKGTWEPMIAIDREGFVYSYDDIHDRSKAYGNLTERRLAQILGGSRHLRVIHETRDRVSGTCAKCDHFGETCSSYPMVEGARDFWDTNPDGSIKCTAFTGLIRHVERRLREGGAIAPSPAPVDLARGSGRAVQVQA